MTTVAVTFGVGFFVALGLIVLLMSEVDRLAELLGERQYDRDVDALLDDARDWDRHVESMIRDPRPTLPCQRRPGSAS